jgi:phage baseplate assembly protein gpV
MAGEMFQAGVTQTYSPKEKKVSGVTTAVVIDNIDCMAEARVQLKLPWLPGFEPWARVATPMAGMGRGTFFIPQIGDEVLVAFNHGDVREPYIIGSLWNTLDRPPALSPTDAVTKRVIRTPLGQEVSFDEALQTVSISNTTKQTLTLGPMEAELAAGTFPPPTKASVTLSLTGEVTIEGAATITLKAPLIRLEGKVVEISAKAAATLNGGGHCTIAGGQIDIG